MERVLRWHEHIGLNIYWLGINIASGVITPLLLPYLVALFMPAEHKNTYLALVRSTGLAVAMLAQPIFGMLSDRSTSRWGRRRPFIAASALGNALFLVIIGVSPLFLGSHLDAFFQPRFGVSTAYAVLMAGIVLLQVTSNIGQGAVQGLIPDLVPVNQRGRSSGYKSVLELLPALLVILIGPLVDEGRVGVVVAIIMAGFLVTAGVTLFTAREKPLGGIRQPVRAAAMGRILALTFLFLAVTQGAVWLVNAAGQSLAARGATIAVQMSLMGLIGLVGMTGSIFVGVYLGVWAGAGGEARGQSGFIWWVINRLMFLAAVSSVQTFALYYLRDALHLANAATMTTVLLGVVALFLLPSALAGGHLSDRVGRHRLVAGAGWVAGLGTVVLLFARSFPVVIISGCIIGLGAGAFMATNWALGTDLVPKQDAGRYLGISNLAGAGAGIVGAGIGGPLADFFNAAQPGLGYTVIFAIYAGLFFLSALSVAKAGAPRVWQSGIK